MLSTGVFPLTPQTTTTTSTSSVLFLNKTHLPFVPTTSSTPSLFCKNGSFFSSLPQFHQTHLHFRVIHGIQRTGLRFFALNKRGKGGAGLMEMDNFDDDDEEEEEEEEVEEGDEDEMILPLENMKKLLKNKPRGFGEGKVYDISIEDKLLEEMEQNKEEQAANVSKLKKLAPEVVPSGVRVRVVNLPKKKNVHRDLKSAFQGVRGILNIIPAVSGSKKTRDPICKGFAYVDFKSEEDATRFIQMFSSQSISFGKIQKQIKCEIMNSQPPSSAHVQPADILRTLPQLTVPGLEGDQKTYSNVDDSSLDSWEETASDESDDPDDELVRANVENIGESLESVSGMKLNGDDTVKPRMDSATDSFPSKLERIEALEKKLLSKGKVEKTPERKPNAKVKREKKLVAKGKEEKVPKLKIPGSAKRLKAKEKAVLTDVFSKYGLLQTALASNEGS